MNRRQGKRVAPIVLACLLAAPPAWAQHQGHSGPAPATPPEPAAQTPSPPTQARTGPARPPENTSGPVSEPVKDNTIFHQVLINQLEHTRARRGGTGLAWDVHAWAGTDNHRLWFKSEGERTGGTTEDGRYELLWSRPVSAFWDLQAGLRRDFSEGPRRSWLAFGLQGIAPYWFDIEATAYVGPAGRTAMRIQGEYQWLLTQRTFLVPEVEVNLHGRSDPARGIGSGLSDVTLGVRLRHEIRREFAPYIGVSWTGRFGRTAELARAAAEPVREWQWVAGVRVWF
jgi:copper resistance protein B